MVGLSLRYALPPFFSTWSVKHDDIVILPIAVGTAFNITVNWGDLGHPNNIENYNRTIDQNGSNRPSHTYTVTGGVGVRDTRTVTVTGELPGWSFENDQTSKDLLVSIVEYGGLSLDNNRSQFKDCIRLTSFPATGPSLELPSDCQSMFQGCVLLDCNLNTLNTSAVTDMSFMFTGCTRFNGNLSLWNVQNVFDMSGMFVECSAFTGVDAEGNNRIFDIPVINSVEFMSSMFDLCVNFNGNIDNWNVQNVTEMQRMFAGCENFTGNLLNWNVQNVKDMSAMFRSCEKFNGNLSAWNVQQVADMSSMFNKCFEFTGVEAGENRIFLILANNEVEFMQYMFFMCKRFNGDISEWNIQGVTNMSGMFSGCENFNGNLLNWNVQNVSNMNFMFGSFIFQAIDEDGNLIEVIIPGCVNFTGFNHVNGDNRIFNLTDVNAAVPRSMFSMFEGCTNFNGDISEWDVSNVTNMSGIFTGCIHFRRDVSNWVMTSIQNNASAPSFTNAYIN